jgi:hypothetical protein
VAFAWFNGGQRTPNGVLSQSFSTSPGTTYNLTFDLGAFSMVNHNDQRMQVTVTGNGVLVSQTLIATAPGNGASYTTRNVSFVANSSASTLTFRDVSTTTENVDLLLDHVRLNIAGSTGLASGEAEEDSVARLLRLDGVPPAVSAIAVAHSRNGTHVRLMGASQALGQLQRSTDLQTWEGVADFQLSAEGTLDIEDHAGLDTMAFYRILLLDTDRSRSK